MSKLDLQDLASLANDDSVIATVNSNNAATTAAMEQTLSRDGTSPNQMNATLDMNSRPIINLRAPIGLTEPLRKAELGVFATQLDNLIDHFATTNNNTFANFYATNASLQAATVDPTVLYVRVAGYTAAGDGGGALYVNRFGVPPAHPGYILTANGLYFEIVAPEINVKMLGAVGNGSADDSAALQNARLVIENSNQPDTMYFPQGTYLISDDQCLFFQTAGGPYVIRGDGFSSVIKAKTSAGIGSMIAAKVPLSIRNLCVDGNKASGATSGTAVGSFGIITSADNIWIDNVEVRNFRSTAIAPGEKSVGVPASNFRLTNCYIHDNESGGLFNVGTGGINHLIVNKCLFEKNCITLGPMSDSNAINCSKIYYHRITNNTFIDNININGGQVAVSDGGSGTISLFGIISDNTLIQTLRVPVGGGTENTAGFEINCSDELVANNITVNPTSDGIRIEGDSKHIHVIGNHLSSINGNGINMIMSGGVFGITESRIQGNFIGLVKGFGGPGGAAGISLQTAGTSQTVITDNYIATQNQTPLAGTSNAILVAGNYGFGLSIASYLN
jgi:hypothetical protein